MPQHSGHVENYCIRGGAPVNLSGQVVGIPTLTAVDPEFGNTQAPGIGFAIPSNVVRRIASSLIRTG